MMIPIKKTLLGGGLLLLLAILSGCQNEIRRLEPENKVTDSQASFSFTETQLRMSEYIRPHVLHIKLAPEVKEKLTPIKGGNGLSLQSLPSRLSVAFSRLGVTSMEPLFPTDPRFEKRDKEFGLGRWMVVRFGETTPLQAKAMLAQLEDVEIAEEVYNPVKPKVNITPLSDDQLRSSRGRSSSMPFNDPQLPKQWHYNNTGEVNNYRAGADINLFKAWEIEKGKKSVIVAVIDGGIDYEHPDLKESMWVNQAEANGYPDYDDDGNGFVDDVYGYSFVKYLSDPLPPGAIAPDDESHGTHVAGTVAARNNNGIGVCGVAGGDGTADSGVRLMSCAIFRNDKEDGNAEQAFVYAARNGAVIAQCSWGWPYPGPISFPQSLKDAIDYFIEYAGKDENGKQRSDSPMSGGVVIFAAGNDGRNYEAVPACYEKVIAVSSMAPNFTPAFYTNKGPWVDVMAPGGDQRFAQGEGLVLSTVSPKVPASQGQSYGYMQGTSMACPHVSGIAALIVSHYGGQGYSNKDLWYRLTGSFLPEDINEINPDYRGQLGAGYIDAEACFATNDHKAPEAPKVELKDPGFVSLKLRWSVPKDEDDSTPRKYTVYISESELTQQNYSLTGTKVLFQGQDYINNGSRKVGDEVVAEVKNLKHSTKYYFAVEAEDRWGQKSPTTFFSVSTKENHPPVAIGAPSPKEKILVSSVKPLTFSFKVKDEDGHIWSYTTGPLPKGVSIQRIEDEIHISIVPTAENGEYGFDLTLTDLYGSSSTIPIEFEIYDYAPPRYTGGLEGLSIGLANEGSGITIYGAQFFEVSKHMELKLTASSSNSSVAKVEVTPENNVVITPCKQGITEVRIKSGDQNGEGDTANVQVRVVADSGAPVYAVYPLPARTFVDLLVNNRLDSLEVLVTTLYGEEIMSHRLTVNPKTHTARLWLKELTPGSYRIHVKSSLGSYSRTILKR